MDPSREIQLHQSSAPVSPNGRLESLDGDQEATTRPSTPALPPRLPWPPLHEGYGFRPPSGSSTPLTEASHPADGASPLPDPHGLGWPAKSTISRLHASPAERAACEKRMAIAVRTILECIGEDPNREGLLKTPERYVQAIMWMTRGYEERLAG